MKLYKRWGRGGISAAAVLILVLGLFSFPCFAGERTWATPAHISAVQAALAPAPNGVSATPCALEAWGANSRGQCNAPPGDYKAIAAGIDHSLALRSDGSLAAWGNNGLGQINVPAGNNYIAIAAVSDHSLALRSDGSVAAWGWNYYKQCMVPAGNYKAIAAGGAHSLAIRSDGSVAAWGFNQDGQCDVPAGNYTAIAAGGNHSLAIRSDGSLVAWGSNSNGQRDVPSGNNYVAIAGGGDYSLALRSDGSLVAWGSNAYGQLDVPSGNGYTAIAAGGNHSLALRSDGSVAGWGHNSLGQSSAPPGKNYTAIAVGGNHSLALRPASSLAAWGLNNLGQCDIPQVAPDNNYTGIAGGYNYSLALKSDGTLAAWGDNSYLQCEAPAGPYFTAVAAGYFHGVANSTVTLLYRWGNNNFGQTSGQNFIAGVAAVAGGYYHTLILKTDFSLAAYGNNAYGQCTVPTGSYVAIAAGGWHNLAIKSDGSLVAWGYNAYGQRNVPAGNNYAAVAAGCWHSLALKTDGSLIAWGYNVHGECNVPAGNDYVAIAAGGWHNLALKKDGSIVAWGYNACGQCDVPPGNGYTAIAAGGNHSLALTINCLVNASVSGGHGTVSPTSKLLRYGQPAEVKITYEPHYCIASITDNGQVVAPPYTSPYKIASVKSNHNIVANIVYLCDITAAADPPEGSEVAGTGSYPQGQTVTMKATPKEGYHFVRWTAGGNEVSTSANYSFTAAGDLDLVAHFAVDTFTVKAAVSGGHGSVDPATQTVEYGSGATINIHPDPDYHIGEITDNGKSKPLADPYVIEPYAIEDVREDHEVVVTFVEGPGILTDAYTFYFAEGYTGGGFQEYLCLGNPGEAPLEVKVSYLFSGEPSSERTYAIPAKSRLTANVNTEVGEGKEVSVKCEAPSTFVAERPMYFNYTGGGASWTGGHDVIGTNSTAGDWYFAEGYTGAGFDEWICVLNPGEAEAALTFYFQTQEEGEKVVEGRKVPPHSRASFKANALLGGSYQASLRLSSNMPVVAERSMYFDYGGTGGWSWTGGHCVMGVPSLARDYFFAEGTTRAGFEEWLTLQNPGGEKIDVAATYLLGSGDPVSKVYALDPHSRATLYVPAEVGGDKDVSIHLSSASDFLAERPMYFSYSGTGGFGWTGGHCVIGATANSPAWFFAEGYTGPGFEEWLCIQNPGDIQAAVSITYYPEAGHPIVKEHQVPGNSRGTVLVNSDAGANKSISAEITSDQPVIVERPMYFNYNGWTGGHDVVGYTP